MKQQHLPHFIWKLGFVVNWEQKEKSYELRILYHSLFSEKSCECRVGVVLVKNKQSNSSPINVHNSYSERYRWTFKYANGLEFLFTN